MMNSESDIKTNSKRSLTNKSLIKKNMETVFFHSPESCGWKIRAREGARLLLLNNKVFMFGG